LRRKFVWSYILYDIVNSPMDLDWSSIILQLNHVTFVSDSFLIVYLLSSSTCRFLYYHFCLYGRLSTQWIKSYFLTNRCGMCGFSIIMTSTKYKVEKFTGLNDFSLWRFKMCTLLVQQGLLEALKDESRFDASMALKKK